MSYVVMYSQKKRIWRWIAVNKRKKILGFEVGDRSEATADKLFKKLKRLEPSLYCTDSLEVFKILIHDDKHITSKSETYTIEGVDNIISYSEFVMHAKAFIYKILI